MPPVILMSESLRFSGRAAEILRGAGELRLTDLGTRAELLASVPDVDVLWVRLRHRIDRAVLDAGRRLQVIATATTGLNHVDVEEAARRNIRVVSLRGETEFLRDVPATAEHTIALLFALIRHIPAAAAHVKANGWDRDLFRGSDLQGKTVGIIGYGRVGRMVARYLGIFGVRVLASDPAVTATHGEATIVPLEELLRESDVVSLHANLTETTRGLLGRAEFARMKPGAWFINTARGELVEEAALLAALEEGRLAGAALDVLCDENAAGMGSSALVEYARGRENLILTPHIGGCTAESMEKTEVFLARRIVAALSECEALCAG